MEKRKRGRPPTGSALSAAERMRAYRRRLRERGMAVKSVTIQDPVVAAARFRRESLLTPAEKDVIRRFCAGMRKLPALPERVAVFGSRAKGGAHIDSDLDLAVLISGEKSAKIDSCLAAMSAWAVEPYQENGIGIRLRPVALFSADRKRAFFKAICNDMDTVWTRPR